MKRIPALFLLLAVLFTARPAGAFSYFHPHCDCTELAAVVFEVLAKSADSAQRQSELRTVAEELRAAVPGCFVTPQEIWKAFDDNEVAAEEKYKDSIVTIKGNVSDIFSNPWGTAVLSFQVEGHHKVDCEFPSKARPQIAKLSKGQEVTVRGKVGHMAMKILLVQECVLR